MKQIENQEIADYISSLTEMQKELVLSIRDIVLSADNRLKEGLKWGSIAFFNEKNICGYRVAKNHVTLLFMEGASLTDTYGILNGTGAKARTIKVTTQEEIHKEGITDLLQQALEKGM